MFKHLQLLQSGSMMAAAIVDMNQKIISMNLDILEEQRSQMHQAVDQYVDKVIDAGRQWTTRRERNQSTFLEIHKITSKAMAFLSMKCDEMKSELESGTSDLIGGDAFTLQHKNAHIVSAGKPATTHGKGKGDDTDDVKTTHTFTNPNLESDQQARHQDVYNQLKSVLIKQDKLEQQLNIQLNNLREDTESLKSDIGTFNQYVETGKGLLKDYSQKFESLENTVSSFSEKNNEMYSDQQVLVDRINSHLSDKDDQVFIELSDKVDHITTGLTDKAEQVSKDLSAKVSQIHKDLSVKVDQINVVLQSLTNSKKEPAAQINKIIDLEKHFHTIEKDTQDNDKQVRQRLHELGKNLFDVTQKLTDVSATVATTCAKKSDLGAVGFIAERKCSFRVKTSKVGQFETPTFIAGCQFNSETGMFTASSEGIYLANIKMCLNEDGYSCVSLIHEYTDYCDHTGPYLEEAKICCVQAETKGSTVCSLDMIKMDATDRLFIRNSNCPFFNCGIKFYCFKIG